MLMSGAIARLEEGMWGGLRRPEPVQKMKHKYPKGSIGSGPWRDDARERVYEAALEGKISVYVAASESAAPTLVPARVIGG
jgi:hypothetical protein